MWTWIKTVAHHLAVRFYGALELLDIPKIRELPENRDTGR